MLSATQFDNSYVKRIHHAEVPIRLIRPESFFFTGLSPLLLVKTADKVVCFLKISKYKASKILDVNN